MTPDEMLQKAQEEAMEQAVADDVEERKEASTLGARIGDLERQIAELRSTSLEGATVDRIYLGDGQGGRAGVVDSRSGVVVKDTSQPTPTAPTQENLSELGVVEVRWDGLSAELDPAKPPREYVWLGTPNNAISAMLIGGVYSRTNFALSPTGDRNMGAVNSAGDGVITSSFFTEMPDGPQHVRQYHRLNVIDEYTEGEVGWSNLSERFAIVLGATGGSEFYITMSTFVRYTGPLDQVTAEYRVSVLDEGFGPVPGLPTLTRQVTLRSGEWTRLNLATPYRNEAFNAGFSITNPDGKPFPESSSIDATGVFVGVGLTEEEVVKASSPYFDGDRPEEFFYRQVPQGTAFGRVQTRHRKVEGGVVPDPNGPGWAEGGSITTFSGGSTLVALGEAGTHAIWFYMVGPNQRQFSAFSEPLFVEVEELVDSEEIQRQIDEKAAELEEVIHDYGNREGTNPPTEVAPAGVIYYQKDNQGRVLGIWQSQGNGDWVGLPLNSSVLTSVTTDKLVAGESLIDGVLIKDGAITLEKITVTEQLTAAVAQFLVVNADMIAANAIDGMRITGGTLVGGEIRGGYLEIGERFSSPPYGERGVVLDYVGTIWHYNQQGNIDTRIDGINNQMTGALRTYFDATGAGVIVNTGVRNGAPSSASVFFSIPGVGQNASGTHAQISSSTGDVYGQAGDLRAVAAVNTDGGVNSSLDLQVGGNFYLMQGNGTQGGYGIIKSGYDIRLQGRTPGSGLVQTFSAESSSFSMSGYAAASRSWTLVPVPVGKRRSIATPVYIHSTSSSRAKVGVNTSSASAVRASIGDVSEGVTWRIYIDSIWVYS